MIRLNELINQTRGAKRGEKKSINSLQNLPHIQIHLQLVRLQRGRKVRQILAVIDGRVARDVHGDDVALVLGEQFGDGQEVRLGGHVEGVVAGFEDEVVHEGLADGFAVDGEVEGYVALYLLLVLFLFLLMMILLLLIVERVWRVETYHGDGHDGWVGDEDFALEVGPVGALGEVHLAELEAVELVQACDSQSASQPYW